MFVVFKDPVYLSLLEPVIRSPLTHRPNAVVAFRFDEGSHDDGPAEGLGQESGTKGFDDGVFGVELEALLHAVGQSHADEGTPDCRQEPGSPESSHFVRQAGKVRVQDRHVLRVSLQVHVRGRHALQAGDHDDVFAGVNGFQDMSVVHELHEPQHQVRPLVTESLVFDGVKDPDKRLLVFVHTEMSFRPQFEREVGGFHGRQAVRLAPQHRLQHAISYCFDVPVVPILDELLAKQADQAIT